MKIRKNIATTLQDYLNEQVSNDTLRDMQAFGLSNIDIDNNGYVTLYHGGKELPKLLRADEIFFMTSSYDEALNYAKIRNGKVFQIKVKPDDVNWNQGSYEVEFDKGGVIRNGKIIPTIKDKKYMVNSYNQIKNSHSEYKTISDELFKWIERTLNYYITQKKMTPNDSYNKLINDIDYFYSLDEEDRHLTEFSEDMKYNNISKLSKDLFTLLSINFNQVFY